jgi:hypothetical protein
MSTEYRVVPVEPTDEMIAAVEHDSYTFATGDEEWIGCVSEDMAREIYTNMLTAAPVPPASGEVEVHRYQAVSMFTEDGNKITYAPHGPWMVMASVHDYHVTQLQAEVAEVRAFNDKAWAEAMENARKADTLQSELTKARKLSSILEDALKHLVHNVKATGKRLDLGLAMDSAKQALESASQRAKESNTVCSVCNGSGIECCDGRHACTACNQSAPAAKTPAKTCIECGSQYCHGVCVERGDDDYLSREIRDGDRP